MIRLYRINTGSCGGCDVAINEAIVQANHIVWADAPQSADALLLTGPITHSSKAALLNLLREVEHIPLFAIGRCAIDGHPFGKGGVQQLEEITVQLQHRLDGCPPLPEAIIKEIQAHL